MLNGKDLMDAGYIVQARSSYVTVFSNIKNFESLTPANIGNRNYEYFDVEVNFDTAESDLWIERNGLGKGISFNELEEYMENSESIDEFSSVLGL